MKLTCSKNELLKSVNISLRAVSSKTTMPILECILIDASADQIHFLSNDMDLGIDTIVEGMIHEKGKVAIHAKTFSDIIRRLPNNDVHIQVDNNMTTIITCEKAKFTIPGRDHEEFTYLPMIDKNEKVTISQFTLKEIIHQTIFSIAANENNKLMTGELFEIKNNFLRVVSLDGHRIAIRKVELKESYQDSKVIVPGKTLTEISKILSGEMEDLVDIYFSKNHIQFEFGKTRVVSSLIDGEYFRIEQMLSSDYETKVRLNKKEFMGCIDRASLLVNEGDKKPFIINIVDGLMQMSINSPLGSMNEEMEIVKEGQDLMIGFNPRFMMDAMRVIDDEEITIYLVNPKAPCFIKNEEESYIYLILPVNFNGGR